MQPPSTPPPASVVGLPFGLIGQNTLVSLQGSSIVRSPYRAPLATMALSRTRPVQAVFSSHYLEKLRRFDPISVRFKLNAFHQDMSKAFAELSTPALDWPRGALQLILDHTMANSFTLLMEDQPCTTEEAWQLHYIPWFETQARAAGMWIISQSPEPS